MSQYQDRDGAVPTIFSAMQSFPSLEIMFADSGYAGPKLYNAQTAINSLKLEIVKRGGSVKGFAVIAKRWRVERTFA